MHTYAHTQTETHTRTYRHTITYRHTHIHTGTLSQIVLLTLYVYVCRLRIIRRRRRRLVRRQLRRVVRRRRRRQQRRRPRLVGLVDAARPTHRPAPPPTHYLSDTAPQPQPAAAAGPAGASPDLSRILVCGRGHPCARLDRFYPSYVIRAGALDMKFTSY